MKMIIHLVLLLVLTVTSNVTIVGSSSISGSSNSGSDEVVLQQSKQNNNDNQQIQVTLDANFIATSTEVQGAILKNEKETATKKVEVSTPATGFSRRNVTEIAKESTASNYSSGKKRVESINSAKATTAENEQGASRFSSSAGASESSSLFTTTSRMTTRQGAGSQNRDSKLMSLLAARRSALQRSSRFGSHRRVATTNRTTVETTSKAPSDPRSTCERNCTKNFTRRTTASCMRRCVSIQRAAANATTPTPSSARTKVDEKDNNEILFTDESSHGFFVVTKDINDTANHISDETKIASSSTEKNSKIRTKLRSPSSLSIEDVEMRPYVYFGQKLPPLKPTALKITKVSDEHPKILEVSAINRPTERSKIRARFNTRDRNIAAYNRRHSLGNYTRQIYSSNTNRPFLGALKINTEERFLKSETVSSVDHTPLTLLPKGSHAESAKLQFSTESPVKLLNINNTNNNNNNSDNNKEGYPFVPVTLILEDVSTPLIINVPDTEESTSGSPSEIIPQHISTIADVTPTLVTQEIYSTTTTAASVQESTSTAVTKPQTTPRSTTTTTIASTTISSTSTSTSTSKSTTSPPLEEYSPTPVTVSIPEIVTRTTMSSSIRSTVNPMSSSTTIFPRNHKSIPPISSESPIPPITSILPNITQKRNTSEVNSTLFVPLDFIAITEDQNKSTKNADGSEIEGIVSADNEVTLEMRRINTATYVLAGLGMFPVTIIILYVGKTILLKRRSKAEDDLDNYITDQQPISPVRKMDSLEDEKLENFSIISSYQEFDRKKLHFKSLLGEGNFGQVWKAEADDLTGHLGTTRIVAVKTVRSGSSQVGLKEEAEIMRKFGFHPNVVTLLGACIETEPHLLIMEYAMRGRLLSLLRAARSATNILPASVPGGRSLAPLSPRTLAGFALDIARGMEYIAEKKIVHRDLAARNVLLDHNGVCKICDFGMSLDLEAVKKTQTPTRRAEIIRTPSCVEHRLRLDLGARLSSHWNINHNNSVNHDKKSHDSISKRPALPIRWMAPEALQYHIFSTETDVWAFGIVLWEIATLGCTPYPNLSGREVVRCVPNGARPEIPKDGRHDFYELMSRCWHKDPRQRPTFKEARIEISRTIYKWVDDDTANSDYMDVSGFSEDLEHGMVYFNRRISEFECDI